MLIHIRIWIIHVVHRLLQASNYTRLRWRIIVPNMLLSPPNTEKTIPTQISDYDYRFFAYKLVTEWQKEKRTIERVQLSLPFSWQIWVSNAGLPTYRHLTHFNDLMMSKCTFHSHIISIIICLWLLIPDPHCEINIWYSHLISSRFKYNTS